MPERKKKGVDIKKKGKKKSPFNSLFFSFIHFCFSRRKNKKKKVEQVHLHNHSLSKDKYFYQSMLDIMDTYNHNNIHHRYDKYTNHKDSSRYTKHIPKKVIIIDSFFCPWKLSDDCLQKKKKTVQKFVSIE
jgi:hypothetical protein